MISAKDAPELGIATTRIAEESGTSEAVTESEDPNDHSNRNNGAITADNVDSEDDNVDLRSDVVAIARPTSQVQCRKQEIKLAMLLD